MEANCSSHAHRDKRPGHAAEFIARSGVKALEWLRHTPPRNSVRRCCIGRCTGALVTEALTSFGVRGLHRCGAQPLNCNAQHQRGRKKSAMSASSLAASHVVLASSSVKAFVGGAVGTSRAPQPPRGLTPRSTRGPTAGHQARAAPWPIMRRTGLASHRRSRVTSNVRPRENAVMPKPRASAALHTARFGNSASLWQSQCQPFLRASSLLFRHRPRPCSLA